MTNNDSTSRRRFLKVTGVTGAVGLSGFAGCTGQLTGGGGGGPIPVGSIMPITGALSAYGKGMQNGVELAVKDINDAGGPMDREVEPHYKDSETKPSRAIQKYNSLVNEDNIVGFVGAASSGVSVPLAQKVAADQVMQVSHASTSPVLATLGYGEDGNPPKYFGRTAPNDGQQGIVMGMIMNKSEYIGADSASFLYVDNPYGKGLADKAANAFDGEVLNKVGYSKKSTDYSSTLDKVFQGDPDAVGFVGYPGNGRTILKQYSEGGYSAKWVLSEGLNSPSFFESVKDIVAGMYVASPDPEGTQGAKRFNERVDGDPTLFAPHAYDGMFLQALAMHKAQEASGKAIASNIQSVSRPEGETVTVGEFDKAKELIDEDTTINYEGASSPVDMNNSLEPLNRFAILRITDSAKTEKLETIPRSFFEGKL